MKGLEVLDGSTRDVKIAKGGDAKVDWRVRATVTGEAVLTGKALTDEESDAMELTLPINPYGVKLAQRKAGTISGRVRRPGCGAHFPRCDRPSFSHSRI